jgi:hypothetical protein
LQILWWQKATVAYTRRFFPQALQAAAELKDLSRGLVQSLGFCFYPHLKCLKRFIVLLPDPAARIANDECWGVCIKRAWRTNSPWVASGWTCSSRWCRRWAVSAWSSILIHRRSRSFFCARSRVAHRRLAWPWGEFDPEKFADHYENALKELLRKKQKGEKIERPKEPARTNVVNLMDALRESVQAAGSKRSNATRAQKKKGKKRIEGQREMLLPIPGKKDKEAVTKSTARSSGRHRKAG